eukprot:4955-Heterococcus_DN1.PRE.2
MLHIYTRCAHTCSKIERIVLANAKEYAENMLQAILADDTNQWGGGSLFSRGKAQFTAGGSSSTATAAADAAMNAAAADNCTADSTCGATATTAAAATAVRNSSGIKRNGIQHHKLEGEQQGIAVTVVVAAV